MTPGSASGSARRKASQIQAAFLSGSPGRSLLPVSAIIQGRSPAKVAMSSNERPKTWSSVRQVSPRASFQYTGSSQL